jgi:nitrite reductase/ring-hydroxylating ferredoxin subunit
MPEQRPPQVPTSEEVCLALRRCWQPVARVQDLGAGPQRAVLLGEALAVFLTESGEAAVVADRCPHRGASLAMGRVKGEGVQCPYHGWEWDGREGRCLRIPSLADQRQIPAQAQVKAFPVREHWGLVWTVLGEPHGEPPKVPWFDPTEWSWGHGTPFELPVGFGLVVENFRDVAHLAFVHEATLGAIPALIEPLVVQREGVELTMQRELRGGPGGDQIWGSLRELRNHVIAPNFTSALMFMVRGKRCLLHAARAVSATESAHYWIAGVSEDFDEYSLEETIAAEERLYAEDRRIISAIEPAELSLDLEADVNTLADKFTLTYRRAFVEFVRRALDERQLTSSVQS